MSIVLTLIGWDIWEGRVETRERKRKNGKGEVDEEGKSSIYQTHLFVPLVKHGLKYSQQIKLNRTYFVNKKESKGF